MADTKNNTLLVFDFGSAECFQDGISDKDISAIGEQDPVGTPAMSFDNRSSAKPVFTQHNTTIWQRDFGVAVQGADMHWAPTSQIREKRDPTNTINTTFFAFFSNCLNDDGSDDCQSSSGTVSTVVSDVSSDEEIEEAVVVVEDYSSDRYPDWSVVESEDLSVDDLFADDEWIVTASSSAVLGSLVGICT